MALVILSIISLTSFASLISAFAASSTLKSKDLQNVNLNNPNEVLPAVPCPGSAVKTSGVVFVSTVVLTMSTMALYLLPRYINENRNPMRMVSSIVLLSFILSCFGLVEGVQLKHEAEDINEPLKVFVQKELKQCSKLETSAKSIIAFQSIILIITAISMVVGILMFKKNKNTQPLY